MGRNLMRRRIRGIFCLEGDWEKDLTKNSSVRPVLELLSQFEPCAPHIYRGIGTREEFDYFMRKWVQKTYDEYPVLFMAFHGKSRAVYVGDRRRKSSTVTLDEIAEIIAGRCEDRIIHFGTCSTLDCDSRHIKKFIRETGALAVSGYGSDVNWVPATAFELLVLHTMLWPSLTWRGAQAMRSEILRVAKGLAKDLRFRMVIREPRGPNGRGR